MRAFLTLFARAVGTLGSALLLAALAHDTRWMFEWRSIVVLTVLTMLLRASPIPLTKFSTLTLVAMVAVAGALVVGAPSTAIGVYVGVLAADWLLLRKPLEFAWINAGREVTALIGAYGLFAFYAQLSGASDLGGLTTQALPAAVLFLIGHFIFGRALQYFTLLVRGKLQGDEQSLILRYEVIGFAAGTTAVAIVLLTIANTGWRGWVTVGLVLASAGLVFKRILEESIAAEELNKIYAMEQVVSADVDIADAFQRIQLLAHRLLDWSELRIWRVEDGQFAQLYSTKLGLLEPPEPEGQRGTRLRRVAVERGSSVIVTDAFNDPNVELPEASARSKIVTPLRFGERTLGIVEIDHHKRATYGAKEVQLVERFGNQLATTLHIHDLRRPLLEAVSRVGEQLDTLNESARQLRGGGEAVARHIADITRGIAEEAEEVGGSLAATESLHAATQEVARDGRDAAGASRQATDIASENRQTIATAIERLVSAKGFVAESADEISTLSLATRRMTEFIAVIRQLAEQTNLLSLNASIEAARAGEHGRGFAVVASEVGKLAVESANTASDASDVIEGFEEQMRRVLAQMERGQTMVRDVEALSASALGALDQIVETTASSFTRADRIARVSDEQQAEFGRLRERVARIADIARRNRDGAESVTASATQQASALAELEGATSELRSVALHLGELTRRLTSAG